MSRNSYSKTPLPRILGIKEGSSVAIIDGPHGYESALGVLPARVTISSELNGRFDLIQIFARDKSTLKRKFEVSKKCMKPNGSIWISWPKRSSGLQTTLGESDVRELGLKIGLVDVKICAIDEIWSGLKFVVRLKDRM